MLTDRLRAGCSADRSALQRLLSDIEDSLVNVVVVYKIDRLSTSLLDFSKLVEVFDRNNVTFVSVTQSLNTNTSMARLTLTILVFLAQFEREVTAERIRDKVKASRMKGIFMGGTTPYGYKPIDRKLVVDEEEAKNVRWIFSRFLEIGSATKLAQEAAKRGIRTLRGNPMSKNFLYRMLNNRAYIGETVHKGTGYAGEHERLIDQRTWEQVQSILQQSPRLRASNTRAETPALLKGLLYGSDGAALSPTHTRKGGRLCRYYVSQTVLKHGTGTCAVPRVPAAEIEATVIGQIRTMLRAPEVVMSTWKAARTEEGDLREEEVREALTTLDPLWEELFPAEQARIIHLLIGCIEVGAEGIKICFRDEGFAQMVAEVGIAAGKRHRDAA